MGHIEGGTKKATEAWSEFAKSDAQKLTAAMQRFDNMLSRVGTKTLPFVTSAINGLINGFEGIGTGIDVIRFGWDEALEGLNTYEEAVKRGAKEATQLQKKLADRRRGMYDVLTEASRKYYAEANKQEFQLADTRDRAIAAASTSFETATNKLSSLYEDNLKKIEKFANDAAGNVVKAFERIAGLERDIDKSRLEFRLRQAEGYYEKLAILDEAYQKAAKERAEAVANITADPASEQAAREASERELEIVERIQRLSEQEGVNQAKAQKLLEDTIVRQIKGLEKFAEFSKTIADNSGTTVTELTKVEARMKEILARQDEIHKDGIIDKDEKKELEEISDEYDKLEAKFKEGAAAFKLAGLDLDFNELVDGVVDALNQAHKDWAAEVELAKAAFAEAIIPIRISLDPEGVRAEFQKLAGQEQLPGETTADFSVKGDEAAKKILEDTQRIEDEIQVTRTKGAAALEKTSALAKEIASTDQSRTDLVNQQLQGSENVLDQVLAVFGVLTQSTEETKLQTLQADVLKQAYVDLVESLKNGGELNSENLEYMKQQVQELFKNKQINQEQFEQFKKLNKQLDERAELEEQITTLKEQQAPDELIAAAEALLLQQLELSKTTELEVKQQEKLKELEEERTTKLEEAKKTVDATANSTANTANSTGEAATQAGNFTGNISNAAEPLAAAATQSGILASNMERAAIAAASIGDVSVSGGGSNAYHGGPFYAAGGLFRGQDRQLAALAEGETVVNRKQSRRFFSELNAMNQGSQPVYRDQGGPVTNVGDVNVTVQGGDSSQQTVREIGHALRREVKRGNITLR
jgi:hypothetical protein